MGELTPKPRRVLSVPWGDCGRFAGAGRGWLALFLIIASHLLSFASSVAATDAVMLSHLAAMCFV
uniref:hypothetical protein n=1 Tax=Photorhabdus sp. RM322S TaxID=3342825 RepID=UPI0036DB4CFD